VPDVIVNKNGVFIDTHVRYRTISDNLSKQEYKFLLTTTLTISERDIIYSFCKMYALDKKVDQLLPLSAKNGLINIVYDSGTFIRNQNIKGCDYD
jgi:hypothetical protein